MVLTVLAALRAHVDPMGEQRAVVLYLAWVSFVELKAVCLLCLTTDAAVIAVFLGARIIRTHDVTATRRAASIAARIREARGNREPSPR